MHVKHLEQYCTVNADPHLFPPLLLQAVPWNPAWVTAFTFYRSSSSHLCFCPLSLTREAPRDSWVTAPSPCSAQSLALAPTSSPEKVKAPTWVHTLRTAWPSLPCPHRLLLASCSLRGSHLGLLATLGAPQAQRYVPGFAFVIPMVRSAFPSALHGSCSRFLQAVCKALPDLH